MASQNARSSYINVEYVCEKNKVLISLDSWSTYYKITYDQKFMISCISAMMYCMGMIYIISLNSRYDLSSKCILCLLIHIAS